MSPRDEVLDIIRQNEGHERVISIPTAFVELTGDITSAGLLAQLLYWTSRSCNAEGWVYKSHADWKHELGMGRSAVERSRRRLRELGLLRETCRMAQGRRTMHYRIEIDALRRAIATQTGGHEARTPNGGIPADRSAERQLTGGHEPRTPNGGIPADRSAERQPTGGHEPRTPNGGIPADRSAEKQPTGLLFSRIPTTESTAETTTVTTAETPSQTTSETTSESCGAREKKSGRGTGATVRPRTGREEAASQRPPVGNPTPQYYDVVCERRNGARAPGGVSDEALLGILRCIHGFSTKHDSQRLRNVLEDYPGIDHVREFGNFVEHWRGSTLAHPWLALRRWLERACSEAPPADSPMARPYTWKRDAAGRCHTVRNDRAAPAATRR